MPYTLKQVNLMSYLSNSKYHSQAPRSMSWGDILFKTYFYFWYRKDAACFVWPMTMEYTEEVARIAADSLMEISNSQLTVDLMAQMKMHSGEKTNKCTQCYFESARVGDLKKHLRRHSGEKSNKCNQCDYASSYARALRTHLKTHIRRI